MQVDASPQILGFQGILDNAYIHGVSIDTAFILLMIKHTIADLAHDFTKPILDTYARDSDGTINTLLNRLASPYQTFDINANRGDLNSFYNSCTTDAMAKSKFKDALEKYLAANSKPLFNEFLKGDYPIEVKPGSISYVNLFQYMYETYDAPGGTPGNLYWYLDAQFGNVIDKYYQWRKTRTTNTNTNPNHYCKDLAYITDPASGLKPANHTIETRNNAAIFDGRYTGLGYNITLLPLDDHSVNFQFGNSQPFRVEERSNSVNITYQELLTMGNNPNNVQSRLDKILAKSAGDRLQGYSANSTLWPIKPILVTNDILASFYYIYFRGCPVLVTGPTSYKFYDFGGAAIDTRLSDTESASVRGVFTNKQVEGKMNESINKAKEYFEVAMTNVSGGNLFSFNKSVGTDNTVLNNKDDKNIIYAISNDTTYTTDTFKASKLVAGITTVIIDLIEKAAIYERMTTKRDNSSQLFPFPQQDGRLPSVYKPLVPGPPGNDYVNMRTFMDLFGIYSQKVSYSQLAQAFSVLETDVAKPGVVKVIYDDLVEVLRNNITNPSVPIRIIAMIITVIIYDITRPTIPTRSSSRRDNSSLLYDDLNRRKEFINNVMTFEPLRGVATTILQNHLQFSQSSEGAAIIDGIGYDYDTIINSADLAQFTDLIGNIVKSCYPGTLNDVPAFNTFVVANFSGIDQNTGSSVHAIDVLDEAARLYRDNRKQLDDEAAAYNDMLRGKVDSGVSNKLRGKSRQPKITKKVKDIVLTNENRAKGLALKAAISVKKKMVGGGSAGIEYFTDNLEVNMNEVDAFLDAIIQPSIPNNDINVSNVSFEDLFNLISETYINAISMDTRYAWGRMGALAAVGTFANVPVAVSSLTNVTQVNTEGLHTALIELLENEYITNINEDALYRLNDLLVVAGLKFAEVVDSLNVNSTEAIVVGLQTPTLSRSNTVNDNNDNINLVTKKLNMWRNPRVIRRTTGAELRLKATRKDNLLNRRRTQRQQAIDDDDMDQFLNESQKQPPPKYFGFGAGRRVTRKRNKNIRASSRRAKNKHKK